MGELGGAMATVRISHPLQRQSVSFTKLACGQHVSRYADHLVVVSCVLLIHVPFMQRSYNIIHLYFS